jgi:hypothetical protein
MEKCYYSRKYYVYSWINLICGLLVGSTIILISLLIRNEDQLYCGILFALGSAVIVYIGLFIVFLNRKYEVNERGITIQYADRYAVFYPWENVQSACVGITHRSGTGATQDVVIWCTTKKRKCLPPIESRRHTSWEYDFYHCNSVITIEFSEDRYDEFAYYYQENIPDYR